MEKINFKILVIDDDHGIVDLTAIQLESVGYKVFKAYDGFEGIKAALKHKPDLILLDVMMPRMDGFQVCRFLKNYPPYDQIPIIFLTVRKGIGDRQRGLLRGGDDYIGKPINLDDLQKKIEILARAQTVMEDKDIGKSAVAKVKEFSDLSAIMKLGELLDENLFKLTIMEEVSRAVADALDQEEIIKILLIGCMSDIGLGFDRAIYLIKSSDGKQLVGHVALGAFPESGVSFAKWREVINRVKDKTLREIYARDIDSFPFTHEQERSFVADLALEIPDGTKIYDLTSIAGGGDIFRLTQQITALASRKLGNEDVKTLPVLAKGNLVGALVVDNFFCRRPVTTEDIKNLIILCNQVGLAIERCRLLEEQNRWTEELERLSNLNLSIIHAAGVGIVYLDPEGSVVTWNRAMARMTKLDAYKVMSRNIFEVFPNLADSFVNRRLKKVFTKKVEERVGHFKTTLGKRTGYFDIKMSPVVSRDVMQGVVLLIEDNTVRINLENKNREVFQYLSEIIDFSADAIITTDRNGRIRTWNRGAIVIFGHEEGQVKGRNIGILFQKGRSAEKAAILKKTSSGEIVHDHETMLVSKNGDRLYASLTASPIQKTDGSIKTISFFIRDITDRKNLIAQLVQAEKLASMGVMAAGMAHEINNPLTSIVMHSQLISVNDDLSTQSREYLDKISEEVERISEIVNDLLIYSRDREKKLQRLRIKDILAQAVVFIERKTATDNIKVDLSVDKNIPPLEGKPNELLEIFLNILLNAVHAISKGGFIKVRAIVEQFKNKEGRVEDWLKVDIEDNGHGIPESKISKIFDPFYTTKPPGKGTGLGLMVVSQLVDKYGGSIKVVSKVKKGTKFTVSLPYDVDQAKIN